MALTTDATPRIHLTPAQVLQDPHRMEHLKAALSSGIFRYVDDEVAARIIDETLQVCGRSSDTLSQVLQTKLFAGHTPFYWMIVHRTSMPTTPPLLTGLLATCDLLTLVTQEDIVDALYREYDSDLYCAIKDRLTDVPAHEAYSRSESFSKEVDRPILTASSLGADATTATVNFKIPRFFDRLFVNDGVTFEFLLVERLWRLKLKLQDGMPRDPSPSQWFFEISEVRCKGGYASGRFWEITIEIAGAEGKVLRWQSFKQKLIGQYWEYAEVISDKPKAVQLPDGHLARLLRNPYTSNEKGQLSGTINLIRHN